MNSVDWLCWHSLLQLTHNVFTESPHIRYANSMHCRRYESALHNIRWTLEKYAAKSSLFFVFNTKDILDIKNCMPISLNIICHWHSPNFYCVKPQLKDVGIPPIGFGWWLKPWPRTQRYNFDRSCVISSWWTSFEQ